ncbi:hypothetical protein LEP1GSC150_4804 [Leptospira interrogans serovar Copenhageni str. LT2050]|uniref:Uncharacterized protein n=1 Tax=Leptospira interrogans serovar Copenhageni str. LT2050 TaxID=1001598 RepID=M3HB17_LEPIT|nr:hypothetical protein LEP1GSC150_4804 [Leptospira interrogans serovar Copenhageni str. LT2050]
MFSQRRQLGGSFEIVRSITNQNIFSESFFRSIEVIYLLRFSD